VVIGLHLPAGYSENFLEPGFLWSDPTVSRDVGGHCVLAVGFSDARGAIRIHDCQGPSKFDGGEWWMGYRVVDSAFVVAAFELT